MKRLACEICGGTELRKQDGVFVCQNCGCQYTADEAKKMMVEGTVKIEGKVSIDRSEELENHLKLTQSAIRSGKIDEAMSHADEGLAIDSQDPRLWLAKLQALVSYPLNEIEPNSLLLMPNLHIPETKEAGSSALALADEDDSLVTSVYIAYLERSLYLFDHSHEAKSQIAYQSIVTNAEELTELVPEAEYQKTPLLAYLLNECAESYPKFIHWFLHLWKVESKGMEPKRGTMYAEQYRGRAAAMKEKAASSLSVHLDRIFSNNADLKREYDERQAHINELENRLTEVRKLIPTVGGFGKKKKEQQSALKQEEALLSITEIPRAKEEFSEFTKTLIKDYS